MRLFLALALALLSGPALSETRVPESRAEISLSFAPLVREAAPAVVNIYARRVVETRRSPFAEDPFFGEFFREFGQRQPRVQNSLGSGVILSDDGIVVSNYHVIGQATDISVVLNDRREYSASVLLADEQSDLAILQLDGASDMPHLPLRDSDTVEVGELTLAIGNPFGVGQTVSSGIVSGLARSGVATGNMRGYFIQTDAPINPGNSGGALIDTRGRLIGINTSILTRSGGSNGIGFAIPASLVAQFVAQARDGQDRFLRPWAGMNGQAVDADLSDGLGLALPGGVVISELHAASPFAVAGIEVGDVILAVDDLPVNTPAEMIYRMSVRGIGASVTVDYMRGGRPAEARVTLIAPPDDPPREELVLGREDRFEGLRLARLNPALRDELGLAANASGVIVLEPGAVGARIGLRAGDILLAVGRYAIERPSEAARLLGQASGRVAVQVQRGNRRLALRFRV
ncbi:MAG: trypsin-like peptidase domain-containing protein [Marinovum algicola]|uniref:Do/DeqQ family serine protease n=1 Tax=Marinovum algicola TaxID=42444 RepID=A0A975W6A1_9RHOB|nr:MULTISPECIES: trypsin-like peptidase domain-containing protein [Marinovum]MDD9743488.1 trypsin-like peptidase domain-containing protein [Marinovum sp. PR37]SEI50981.1 Do/DeqQ family serine protease [Marinovum algicola]SLN30611.1 Periplasmic pH-dependent serine endoprotease DegQ precursor [Marinovum algicola]